MRYYEKLKNAINLYIDKNYIATDLDFDLFLLIAKSRVINKMKKKDLYLITDELKIEGSYEKRETQLESLLFKDITYRTHKREIKKLRLQNNIKKF